jgi:adenine-specific DNA methylase
MEVDAYRPPNDHQYSVMIYHLLQNIKGYSQQEIGKVST